MMKNECVSVPKSLPNDTKQPYTLDEVWVQISGVLPKWSNWISFKQIASSHSKIMEIVSLRW
jgi:hypothetical protein